MAKTERKKEGFERARRRGRQGQARAERSVGLGGGSMRVPNERVWRRDRAGKAMDHQCVPPRSRTRAQVAVTEFREIVRTSSGSTIEWSVV